MQGERSYLGSFPETINLNQGDSSAASMERSAMQDNLLNPAESHLSNYAASSGEGNNNLPDPLHVNARSLGGWYSASSNTSAVDWRYEPPNIPAYDSNSSGYDGSYMQRPLNMNASSTYDPVNANLIQGYRNPTGENSQTGGNVLPHINQPGGSERHHFPTENLAQNGDGLSSSSSMLGSSSKRKTIEGCSGQSSSVGYLSPNAGDEDMRQLSIALHLNCSSSSCLQNPRNEVGIGQDGSEECPQRNFDVEACIGQQESVLSDFSVPGTDIQHAILRSAEQPSRFVPTTELSELGPRFSGPIPSNYPPSQSNLVQVPGSGRNTIPYSLSEFYSSRGVPLSASQVEAAARSFTSSLEQSTFSSIAEARNVLPESPDWSFMPANLRSYRNIASSSHADPSSSRSVPSVWMNHPDPAIRSNPRFHEHTLWTRFPSAVEPALRGERGNFSPFPSGPSSQVEAVMPSGSSTSVHHNLSHSRSFMGDLFMDDINGWRALAGGGGRDRLISEIRTVLDAMRRAEGVGVEEYTTFEPFFTGRHDSHIEMRLDVDNMSYEELIALEEHMGNVKTGLTEDEVMQLLKQSKYKFVTSESSVYLEPCCVCQEDYIVGDDIGELDCGHEFHTNCIKQWLMLKNLCPICKMTGLLV